MNKPSSKRLFFYISVTAVLAYSLFVLLAYNAKVLPKLYTLKECSIYYVVLYLLFAAVSYTIDTQTKKEAGLLTLLCFPIFTLIFLGSLLLIGKFSIIYLITLFIVIAVLYVIGYITYKRWISKILLIKKGYENILLAYVIIHLFVSLFIAFKIIGLL